MSEARVWRRGSSQQDILVAVAAAPSGHVTGHAPNTWPLATLHGAGASCVAALWWRPGRAGRASRFPRAGAAGFSGRNLRSRRAPNAHRHNWSIGDCWTTSDIDNTARSNQDNPERCSYSGFFQVSLRAQRRPRETTAHWPKPTDEVPFIIEFNYVQLFN